MKLQVFTQVITYCRETEILVNTFYIFELYEYILFSQKTLKVPIMYLSQRGL